MIVEALGAVISEQFGDVAGQKYNVSYAIYDGNSGTESMTVQFDGNTYVAVGGMAYDFSDEAIRKGKALAIEDGSAIMERQHTGHTAYSLPDEVNKGTHVEHVEIGDIKI